MGITERFAQTIGMYFTHEMRRTPTPLPPSEPKPEPKETDIKNSRHANSTRAVQTRKSKYGKSKLKRKTRESMKKEGQNVNTDGE